MSGSGQVIVGGLSVSTVTVKLQLPPPVDELTLTVCVPTEKKETETGDAVTVPQSPEGSAEPNVTMAPDSVPCVVLAVTVILPGHSSAHVA